MYINIQSNSTTYDVEDNIVGESESEALQSSSQSQEEFFFNFFMLKNNVIVTPFTISFKPSIEYVM